MLCSGYVFLSIFVCVCDFKEMIFEGMLVIIPSVLKDKGISSVLFSVQSSATAFSEQSKLYVEIQFSITWDLNQ